MCYIEHISFNSAESESARAKPSSVEMLWTIAIPTTLGLHRATVQVINIMNIRRQLN